MTEEEDRDPRVRVTNHVLCSHCAMLANRTVTATANPVPNAYPNDYDYEFRPFNKRKYPFNRPELWYKREVKS